jgi:hypothetical protein
MPADADSPLAHHNDDGSLDVWARGRLVRFPGGGKKPAVVEGALPPEEAGPLPDEVGCEVTADLTFLSHDGWLVSITADRAEVLPSNPNSTTGRVFYQRGLDYGG